MSEVSVDRTTEVLTKAQADVQRTSTAFETAQTKALRKQEEEAKAKSAADDLASRLDTVRSTRAALLAQARSIDPDNIGALTRLTGERAFLDMQIDALEGALTRAQSEHAKARADLDTARAALARAEEAQRSAQEKHQEAQALTEESRLVAARDPGALARKDKRERAEAVLADHLRIVRSHGAFSPGGGPCEATIEAEKVRTRHFARPPLDANAVGWGTHAEVRNVSPVGPRGSAEPARPDAPKPYNLADPLSND